MTKEEVRRVACDFGLRRVAEKKEVRIKQLSIRYIIAMSIFRVMGFVLWGRESLPTSSQMFVSFDLK